MVCLVQMDGGVQWEEEEEEEGGEMEMPRMRWIMRDEQKIADR